MYGIVSAANIESSLHVKPAQCRLLSMRIPPHNAMKFIDKKPLQIQKSSLHLHGTVASNHTQMVAALILAGAGIGYMPSWLADDALSDGRLVRLLPQHQIQIPPLYAVYANRRFMKAKVRSFIEFMQQAMSAAQP